MNDVYEAQQLTQADSALRSLQPPATLCVFGDPVAHSRSPQMHNAALKACGLDMQYVRIHATEGEFSAALRALPQAGFVGANVTIPHKVAALNTVDVVDSHAQRAGAVNTVAVVKDKLTGFSTDGPGFVRALREEFAVDLRDLRVMILGAGGGVGHTLAVQCAIEGCERLVLANRTLEKAQTLARELAPYFRNDRLIGPSDRIQAIPLEEAALSSQIGQVDLLVNATSLGMHRSDPPVFSPSLLTANLLVYDTVYASGKSRLVEDAEACGARAANGLSMLLWQGALAFEIWFNRSAPVDAMRRGLAL